VRAALWR